MRLSLPCLALALAATPLQAQDSLPPLSFLGIDAGARLDHVDGTVRLLGGTALRCQRAKEAREVQECRGTLFEPVSGRPLALWMSAMDSATGILTLSGPVAGVELDSLRAGLQRNYGQVDAKVQGSQWMMQWVRQGRMLRFTWRIEKGQKVLSVSLIDGRVLDAWGRRQELRPRPKRPGRPRPVAPADSTAPAESASPS
jgi:hypothetical protein